MSGYSGNGELVLGSFKTIRAFKKSGMKGEEDIYKAITQDDKYEVGKEYVANCRSWGWDIPTLMEILNIPKDQWPGTLITGVHYHSSYWTISLTRKVMKPMVQSPSLDYWKTPVSSVEVTYARGVVHEQSQYNVEDQKMKACMIQHPEESPVRGCSCGFYSFYDIETMLERGTSYISSPSSYYYGVIENYGNVIHCDLGLRSQKMKILAVAKWYDIKELVKSYPLDVFDADALASPPES